jgi:hypothetical protein
VTDVNFLQMLKEQSINGTAGRVSGTYLKNNDGSAQANFYWQEFKDFIKDLNENQEKYQTMILGGGGSTNVQVSNNVTAGYVDENDLSWLKDVRFP